MSMHLLSDQQNWSLGKGASSKSSCKVTTTLCLYDNHLSIIDQHTLDRLAHGIIKHIHQFNKLHYRLQVILCKLFHWSINFIKHLLNTFHGAATEFRSITDIVPTLAEFIIYQEIQKSVQMIATSVMCVVMGVEDAMIEARRSTRWTWVRAISLY